MRRALLGIMLTVVTSVIGSDPKVRFADNSSKEIVSIASLEGDVDSLEREFRELQSEWHKLAQKREGALEQVVFAYMRLVYLEKKLKSLDDMDEATSQIRGFLPILKEQREEKDRKKEREHRVQYMQAQEYERVDRLRIRKRKLLEEIDRTINSCNKDLRWIYYVKERRSRSCR